MTEHLEKLELRELVDFFAIPGVHINVEKELKSRLPEDILTVYNDLDDEKDGVERNIKLSLFEYIRRDDRFADLPDPPKNLPITRVEDYDPPDKSGRVSLVGKR